MSEQDEHPIAESSRQEARHDAAEMLRRFLAAVESGELDANSAQAKAVIRRIEGAVVGLEVDEHDSGA